MVTNPLNVHLAFAHTEPAAVASSEVDLDTDDRKLAEHPVQCPQRAEKAAEGTVAEYTRQPDQKHDHELSCKQNT